MRDAALAIADFALKVASHYDSEAGADGVRVRERVFTAMHARVYFHLSRYAGATSASLYRRWQPLTVRAADPWPPMAGGSLRTLLKHLKRWGLVEHAGYTTNPGARPLAQWRPVAWPTALEAPVAAGAIAELDRLEVEAGTDVTLAAAVAVLRAAITPAGA